MAASVPEIPMTTSWEAAEIGDQVCLQNLGSPRHCGVVDNKTSTGDIVWVVSEGERRLFHKDDGYNLLVRQNGTQDDSCHQ